MLGLHDTARLVVSGFPWLLDSLPRLHSLPFELTKYSSLLALVSPL